jgi:hypothetical protein
MIPSVSPLVISFPGKDSGLDYFSMGEDLLLCCMGPQSAQIL